jgi:drug/metabolite transporter (DMT)-like permease
MTRRSQSFAASNPEESEMNGVLWAAVSGVGFGLFQVLNARAVRGLARVYVGTFVQLLAATVAFVVIVGVAAEPRDLLRIPAGSVVWFALSGVLHFFVGWTTLNQSQARIGAARTAPLIATAPVFGVIFVLFLGELPKVVALVGVALTVIGAYVVTTPGAGRLPSVRESGLGLVTAASWALSAIFTVAGLEDFDDPLLGVTVGMAAAASAYGLGLLIARLRLPRGSGRARDGMDTRAWTLKIAAGGIVALATWWRWLALADAPVEVVLALQLLTVPTVLVLVVLLPNGERVAPRVWGGAAIVLAGVGILLLGT